MSIDIKKHRREIARHLRNGRTEMTPSGLLIKGGMNALCNGVFGHKLMRGEEIIDPALDPNRVVDEALNYIINAAFHGQSQHTQFYIGLFNSTTSITNAAPSAGNSLLMLARDFTAVLLRPFRGRSAATCWTCGTCS